MGIIVYIEFHDGSTSKLHSSVPFCSSINITETNTYCRGVGRAVASGLWYGAYAIPSALFAPRFRQGVGTLVTHGKGGIPSLTQDGREVTTVLRSGKPSKEILRYTEQEGVDAVVTGRQGEVGLSRFLLGSVADKVARRADVPVTLTGETNE